MEVLDVKNLRVGDRLHYTGPNGRGTFQPCAVAIGPRGGRKVSIIEVRVTGQVKTWKRDAGRVEVPFKYGMYEHGKINEDNCHWFHRVEDCPERGK